MGGEVLRLASLAQDDGGGGCSLRTTGVSWVLPRGDERSYVASAFMDRLAIVRKARNDLRRDGCAAKEVRNGRC